MQKILQQEEEESQDSQVDSEESEVDSEESEVDSEDSEVDSEESKVDNESKFKSEEDSQGENQKCEEEENIQDEEEKIILDYNINFSISVKLQDAMFKRIGIGQITELQCQAQCKRCKQSSVLTLKKKPDWKQANLLVNEIVCVNCNLNANIFFQVGLFHENSNVAGRFGSNFWDIQDIFQCAFALNCEKCNLENKVDKYVVGQNINLKCQQCFANINFIFQAYNFTTIEIQKQYQQIKKNEDEEQKDEVQKFQIGQILNKKIGLYKVGTALPKEGTCKHYGHSYRYFRFPCCGKAFPCDDCHNESEKKKHEIILARTMICGFCSSEQKIGDICRRCSAILTKQKLNAQHWEGGKGCRNQITMSKNDKKKYHGFGKTVSKKKLNKK